MIRCEPDLTDRGEERISSNLRGRSKIRCRRLRLLHADLERGLPCTDRDTEVSLSGQRLLFQLGTKDRHPIRYVGSTDLENSNP